MSTLEPVRVDVEGPVCRITLTRPEKLNALNEATRAALAGAVTMLRDSPAIRVVLLRGEGRAFSAGADLADRVDDAPRTWAERRHASGRWQRLLDDLERVPQVTLAAVHGHVIGGAVLLAVACDVRIAADDVQFRIPELALGIPLTWAGIPRLAREIGLPRARDLVMTGRVVKADEALAWGLVTRVASVAELDADAAALVDTLLATPAAPLAMTVDMMRAMGREATVHAWADADLLAWSLREPERPR